MRIVSLISSATEILYLLGLGQQVVGVSHECDFPPDVATKPRLTRSLVNSAVSSSQIDAQVRSHSEQGLALYEVDVELLARLAPDLIVTQAQCDVCAVRYQDVADAVRGTPALTNTRIETLNPSSLADVFSQIEQLAQATGALESARAVLADLHRRVNAIASRSAQLSASVRPRVACLEWIEPPMLAANWTPELVELAGGQSGLVTPGAHSGYASWPAITAYDPQVLVIMPCGFDLPRAMVESRLLPAVPGWSALSAVRSGQVYAVDGNAYFNRSGPRLVDSLEILAHLFHPDLFVPPQADGAWRRLDARAPQLVENHQ